MAVRGLGRWTKLGVAVQMTSNCGVLPFLYIILAVAQPDGRSLQHAFSVTVGIYGALSEPVPRRTSSGRSCCVTVAATEAQAAVAQQMT
jgi:hypothetical protein